MISVCVSSNESSLNSVKLFRPSTKPLLFLTVETPIWFNKTARRAKEKMYAVIVMYTPGKPASPINDKICPANYIRNTKARA